ncbi:kek1 [Cordylochernes scorpioides]|uniref:Kek1 n=1 Tax=Cordylochernes scorpioides TaxID=51811 RepID=A0ABY6JXQ8_9ARAC|nr:kek1 [Cordylochernes scorpioides]
MENIRFTKYDVTGASMKKKQFLSRSLQVYAVLLLNVLADAKSNCAPGCSCKWKSGKQTAECIEAKLLGVPLDLNTNTQVLDLTDNSLQTLPSKVFFHAQIIHLQKLYMIKCKISQIAEDAFHGLSNLIELYLSDNYITEIPSIALRDCYLLRRLELSRNPIQRIPNNSFEGLSQLTSLELRSCQIHTVEPNAFVGLDKLQYLKLDDNKLSTIPDEIIKTLPPLYALDVHRNPWICDCKIRGVHMWMISNNIPFISPPRCFYPLRLKNASWEELHSDEFSCPPHVSAIENPVISYENHNATLGCKIKALPDAVVNWSFKGRPIANLTLMSFGRQMYFIKEYGTIHKINTLTIINVMLKDTGYYLCSSSNTAGNVSVNITLEVNSKAELETGLSSPELAGIILGILFVFCLISLCLWRIVYQQSKVPMSQRKGFIYFSASILNSKNNPQISSTAKTLEDGEIINSGIVHQSEPNIFESTPSFLDNDHVKYNSKDVENIELSNHKERTIENGPDVSQDIPKNADFQEYNNLGSSSLSKPFRDNSNRLPGNVLYSGTNSLSRRNIQENQFGVDLYRPLYQGPHEAVPGGAWKHAGGPLVNQIHHALSPEARDSPDEGLGDEREYETDILD